MQLCSRWHWCRRLPAFGYQPWIDGPARTLSIAPIHADPRTGEAVVNGVDARAPTNPFTWDWADGFIDSGCSPMEHTFQQRDRNYVLQVTAHYDDGTKDTLLAVV